jgi:hypothetical protein
MLYLVSNQFIIILRRSQIEIAIGIYKISCCRLLSTAGVFFN